MFEKMTTFAVQRKAMVLAFTALFCAFGWQRFRTLPIEAFPDVTDPMVEVVGLYPGQAAEEVERKVTLELERVLAGVPGLHDLRSVSVFGLSLVTLTFDEGTPAFQMRALVSERLQSADLPDGAETIMGPQATPVGQIYRYTVQGPRSLRDLRALQDFVIERRLRSVPGVADIITFGGFERQYQVRVEPARLAASGVSMEELHTAIARANANAGGGYVGVGSQEFIVRSIGTAQRAEDLGLSVIRTNHGVPVRVRDVADIVEGSTPRRGAVGRGHNGEVIEGIVLLRRGENPSVVLDALHAKIAQLNQDVLPKGVRIATFYDRSSLVDATLKTVGKNMLEGIALVMAVVYLFLNTWRALLMLACVVPISLLTAFVALSCKGLPANLISLGAIDFGILVDGAIIVIESTLHVMARAKASSQKYATDDLEGHVRRGAAEVAKPVAFAMSIIIIALMPIFALERVEGRIFAPMAFTYAFALVGALLCAVFVVPALEAYMLRGNFRVQEAKWLVVLSRWYANLLVVCRPRRGMVVGTFVAVAVALSIAGAGIGTEFLPELNEGGFYITSTFPSTIALDESRKHVDAIRERILQTPEVADVMSHLGRPESATQSEGPNNAEFFVVLTPENTWRPGAGRKQLESELRRRLAEIPGVQHNFSQPITDRVFETISGIIGQVVVKVRGGDLDALTRVAEQVREKLAHVPGVTDLSIYQAGTVPAMQIALDREALARRGMAVEEVQHLIRLALGDEVATRIWQEEKNYAVVLRLPTSVRSSPEALGRLMVDPDTGLTLGEIAHITTNESRSSIWREDFSRFVAIKFNVRGRDLGGTVEEGQMKVEEVRLPESTYLTWGGEFQNQHRAMRRLGVALPLALLAIVGVLYINFKRWYPTLLIMGFVPLAMAGSVAGLRFLGENFSVSSAVGCIALLGQVVLAGVTVCARIDHARHAGAADGLIDGARDAFRPVLLTTVLALFGLLPAAMSHAMGSETQRPFAIAVVAGLFLVTPALLVLLPLLYAGGDASAYPFVKLPTEASPNAQSHSTLSRVARTMLWPMAFLLLPTTGWAAAPTFHLAQAQALLRQGHPRLAGARANEQAAIHDVATAGLWQNPEVTLDYFKGVNTSSYDPLGVGVLRVNQFLELRNLPGARREAAAHVRDAATAIREATDLNLVWDLEQAFIYLATEGQRTERVAQRLAQVTRAKTIVDARVQAGDMSRYGARRIAVAQADAAADLQEAQAAWVLSRARFDVALGPLADALQGTAELPSSALPTLDELPALLTRAMAQRRDLAAARAMHASALADVRVAERSIFSGVALGVMAGYGQATRQWDVGATLTVPLPIIDRGQSTVPAQQERARVALAAQETLTLAARRDIAAALAAAQLTYQALEHFLADTQSTETSMVQEAEAQFREARLSVLEWVDAIDAAQNVSVRRMLLSRDARLAELRLRRLVEGGNAS